MLCNRFRRKTDELRLSLDMSQLDVLIFGCEKGGGVSWCGTDRLALLSVQGPVRVHSAL